MKLKSIKGFKREQVGKKYTKELIKNNNVPCILYGDNVNIPFYVDKRSIKDLVYTKHTYLVDVTVDSGENARTVIKELQFHPVTDELIHMDFFKVTAKKSVEVDIPIKLIGNSKGVLKGGVINKNISKIKVKGLFDNIPDEVEVDITDVDVNQKLRVENLTAQGYEFLTSPNIVILNVFLPRKLDPKKVDKDKKVEKQEDNSKEKEDN